MFEEKYKLHQEPITHSTVKDKFSNCHDSSGWAKFFGQEREICILLSVPWSLIYQFTIILFLFCFFFLLNPIHFFYVVSFHLQFSSVILLLLLYANPCFEHLKDQSYNVMSTQRMQPLILVIVTYFTFLKFSPYFL